MSKKRSNPLWSILSSVKLTLILLILLALTSILGTVIPQKEGAAQLVQTLSPGLVLVIDSLQLLDMYHSIWFRLIICLLAINLIICSIDRLPATLRLFRSVPRPDRAKPFEGLPEDRTFSFKGEMNGICSRVSDIFKHQYKNILSKVTNNGRYIYFEKGRYTLFGVYLVHLSVLFILVGAIIGSLLGFDAYVNILEGNSVDSVVLRESRGHKHKKLGFQVRCEKFHVSFYDNGTPREYRSRLSFITDGTTIHKGNLLVNHPLKFRGITFYQASYGSAPGNRARLKISKGHGDPADTFMDVELGKPMSLPGDEAQFVLSDIRENFMRMGPAVSILIKTAGGKNIGFWLFKNQDIIMKRFPGMLEKFARLNPSAYEPYTFTLEDIDSRYYTGLQVNRDPGVAFVYAGFCMIMIGLFINFFASHRRFWVRIEEDGSQIRVSLAGKANKNPVGMERELDRLSFRIRKVLAAEGEVNG